MKAKYWIKSLSNYNINGQSISGSPLKTPFYILKRILTKEKPKVYVFRYLNDYNNIVKTILRFSSEFLTILICRVFHIRIWWILHNIDKETHQYYPKITNLRRKFLSQNAQLIFTTDKLLMEYAKQLFPKNKVASISLGYSDENIYTLKDCDSINEKIKEWLESIDKSKSKIIFCIGTKTAKSIHFNRINNFIIDINECDKTNQWYALVVGSKVKEHPNIFNLSNNYNITANLVKEYCDFYYKVMDDYSMYYTVYEACHFKIPILTEDFGILPQVLKHYNIGEVCDDIGMNKIVMNKNKKNYQFTEFLEKNNWNVAAKTFSEYYNNL